MFIVRWLLMGSEVGGSALRGCMRCDAHHPVSLPTAQASFADAWRKPVETSPVGVARAKRATLPIQPGGTRQPVASIRPMGRLTRLTLFLRVRLDPGVFTPWRRCELGRNLDFGVGYVSG